MGSHMCNDKARYLSSNQHKHREHGYDQAFWEHALESPHNSGGHIESLLLLEPQQVWLVEELTSFEAYAKWMPEMTSRAFVVSKSWS